MKADLKSNVFVRHPYEQQLIELDEDEWLETIREDIRNGRYTPLPASICEVPKGDGLVRPGSQLTLRDAVMYTACVGACLPQIIAAVGPRSSPDFAHRLNADPAAANWIVNAAADWEAFRKKSLETVDGGSVCVAISDVTGFYENIDTLISDLRAIKSPEEVIEQLRACLLEWAQFDAQSIPQGFHASDILSKLYLANVDARLRQEGFVHFRYSDDIRVFCKSTAEAKRALLCLTLLFHRRGLNIQSAKSEILPASEARTKIESIQPTLAAISKRYQGIIIDLTIDDSYTGESGDDPGPDVKFDPNDASLEVLSEAFKTYFLGDRREFNKTLFRFVINRLGAKKNTLAVGRCVDLLASHPEETKTILNYFRVTKAIHEVSDAVVRYLMSGDCVYDY
ncbi:MAG: RNA-directed DNA polymerase, partial [Acidobacteriaceae bacterium]